MIRKLSLPLLLGCLTALVAVTAGAETHHFQVDQVHSQVAFKVRHLVAKTPGHFNEFDGEIWLDPAMVDKTLKISGTVQTASIDTGSEDRDKHLRSPDFFDAEGHPEITFVSKAVRKEEDGKLRIVADVSMLGVTHEEAFDVEVSEVMTSPFTGTPIVGLTITGKVNRKDYGMVWNKALDAGGFVLGDKVEIDIQIEAGVPKGDHS